ncbi:MAG: hypothetical protein OSJ54_11700, partial [Oscillospiraceae bacterium]|nr:hypothetical protein [Oscillospiraceae bacterium]
MTISAEIVCVAGVPPALPYMSLFTIVNIVKILPYYTIGFKKYSKSGLRCSLKIVKAYALYRMKVYVHFLWLANL